MSESSNNPGEKKNVSIYIKFPGIKGGVTAKGYEGFIEARRFRLGVNRSDLGINTGNATNRGGGRPNIEEIAIAKSEGPETPFLLKRALTGEVFTDEIEIHTVRSSNEKQESTSVCTLKNVIINRFESDYGENPENKDQPSCEKIGLTFTEIEFKTIKRGKDGAAQSQSVVDYNLATAAAA